MVLKYLFPHWKDWIQAFPNIERIFFSTNGMAFTEDIINFAKEIDKWADHDIRLEV